MSILARLERSDIYKALTLIGITAAIGLAHYLTRVSVETLPLHNIHYLLFFLPILMASLWFGLLGGIVSALVVSAVYSPLVLTHVGGGMSATGLERALEVALYNLVGWVTGILSHRERKERLRYKQAAEQLEESYQQLQAQTGLIVEKEEQLRRADRLSALGELSASVAHEIRNPLSSIKGTAEILKDSYEGTGKDLEFFDILLKEVSRLDRVVTGLLNFVRPRRPELQRSDLNLILQTVLQLVRPQCDKNDIQIETHLSEDLTPVEIDPQQLEQVFLNIILNSVAAMPEGGLLTISTEQVQENSTPFLSVQMTDSGTGIEPEGLPRVFDSFYTTKSDGTGLGLTIARRIIRAHNGSLTLESTPRQGTTVRILIPLTKQGTDEREDTDS